MQVHAPRGRCQPTNEDDHVQHHDVLLLGAGHANLEVMSRAHVMRAAGHDVAVVEPADFWYSGLASAVAGGAIDPDVDRIDVRAWAAHNEVTLHADRAVGLDPSARTLTLGSGTTLSWDVLCVNVGSSVEAHGIELGEDVLTVKPIHRSVEIRDRVIAAEGDLRIVVVGGGASAAEFAGNLAVLARERSGTAPDVTMITRDADVVLPAQPKARARIVEILTRHGVRILTDSEVVQVGGGIVRLRRDGAEVQLGYDLAVVATGLRASTTIQTLGLGDARGMPTRATLQHVDHPRILGAGDCIRFGDDGLPRLGVFGVRQAPILADNLLAVLDGGSLAEYVPQQRFLAAMDLGGGAAIAMRGGRWHAGPLAKHLKRWLDLRWLDRYRA